MPMVVVAVPMVVLAVMSNRRRRGRRRRDFGGHFRALDGLVRAVRRTADRQGDVLPLGFFRQSHREGETARQAGGRILDEMVPRPRHGQIEGGPVWNGASASQGG